MMNKIDFIITWVDSEDPKWESEYKHYSAINDGGDAREVRFRNWENLKYWFRGVEKFAPWVRKVYLITEGHLPAWINLNHEKLEVVKHSDIIPKEHLPTFNSCAIEVNMHKIKGLSDKFVYFNDDFFLIDTIQPSFFFKNQLPCELAAFNALSGGGVSDAILEAITIINKYFNKKHVLKHNLSKWFNLKYGMYQLRTLLLLPWPKFTGFYENHMPMPFLKSTFNDVWNKESEILNKTSASKFRDLGTVNPYLFKYWQLVKGDFYPVNSQNQMQFFILDSDNIVEISETIKFQKKKVVVLNDSDEISNFDEIKDIINQSFDEILPNKSGFEA